jgi:excisionase family DNA binding protein
MNRVGTVSTASPREVRRVRLIDDTYVTVARAAEILGVSGSTLWRWINRGDLPAYRFGHRRVLIKEADLDRMISPARGEMAGTSWQRERERLARPLTESEKRRGLAAMDAARAFRQELLKRRGGVHFSDSTEIVREMREQRTRELY